MTFRPDDMRFNATMFLLSKVGTYLSETPMHDLLAEFGQVAYNAGMQRATEIGRNPAYPPPAPAAPHPVTDGDETARVPVETMREVVYGKEGE